MSTMWNAAKAKVRSQDVVIFNRAINSAPLPSSVNTRQALVLTLTYLLTC